MPFFCHTNKSVISQPIARAISYKLFNVGFPLLRALRARVDIPNFFATSATLVPFSCAARNIDSFFIRQYFSLLKIQLPCVMTRLMF